MRLSTLCRSTRRGALPVAVVIAVQIGVQVFAESPAPAVAGLKWVDSEDRPRSSQSVQTATASCGLQYYAIGGGAEIQYHDGEVRLTEMRPVLEIGVIDGVAVPIGSFVATAEEDDNGFSGDWTLKAFAVCAPASKISSYEIVNEQTDEPSSKTFQQIAASCGGGNRRAIGVGAKIHKANGQVGLQLVRTDAALGIARATAREDADGYADTWRLESYAICVLHSNVPSAAIYGEVAPEGNWTASASCPPDKVVHSVGGGGSLYDTGPYFLYLFRPRSDLRAVTVTMTGPIPDGIAVGAVCAHPS